MKRILFVDDEPNILEGLQRMLRPLRNEWEMLFAAGGQQALAMMEATPVDVIVTDMRMPVIDGSRLLEIVCERYPATIRIVLSGYVERDAALRAVSVAHQFLAKPCDPFKLREAIDRCTAWNALLRSETTRQMVAAIGELPALPSTSAALMEALQNPDASLETVGAIVEQDVGITAKLLQLVNSAFFSMTSEIATVRMAVSVLGFDVLRQLVLAAELFRAFRPKRLIRAFSLEDFQRHSRLTARIASKMHAAKTVEATAIVAALLHDTGKLVLASRLPDQFEQCLERARELQAPLHVVERDLTGATHAQVGAYLLGIWGLPAPIVRAVAKHHDPSIECGSPTEPSVLSVVHIADALAKESGAGGGAAPAPAEDLIDREYIAAAGLEDRLTWWRQMARELVERESTPTL